MINNAATANFNTAAGLAIMNQRFDIIQKAADNLSKCTYLPDSLKGKVNDCSILIELSILSQIPAFLLAQEVYVVHNRFSFSSKFIIGQIRKRFPTFDWEMSGEIGDMGEVRRVQKKDAQGNPVKDFKGNPIYDNEIVSQGRTCLAYAIDKDGRRIDGIPVSMGMAKAEGWYDKSGSKWQTMPEAMLRYRAASFFKNFVCPDVVMGIKSVEEIVDTFDPEFEVVEDAPRPSVVKRLTKAHKAEEPKLAAAPKAETHEEAPQTPAEKPAEPKAVNSPKAEETPAQESKSESTEQPKPEAPQGDAKDEKPLKKLRRLLAEAGLTDAQCKNYCRKNGMLSGGKVDEFAASKILNAWDTVVEFIRTTPATEEDAK